MVELKCLAFLFLLVNFNVVVQGQKLNNKLPSVYLRFKEYVNDNDGNERARLTFRNNTRWPVIVVCPMEEALKGDLPLPYIIELDTGCRDERLRIDVVMSTTLKPGRAVSFTVPLYDFPKGGKIYVEYSLALW